VAGVIPIAILGSGVRVEEIFGVFDSSANVEST
jgi:hypothetical protein